MIQRNHPVVATMKYPNLSPLPQPLKATHRDIKSQLDKRKVWGRGLFEMLLFCFSTLRIELRTLSILDKRSTN